MACIRLEMYGCNSIVEQQILDEMEEASES
jgi:hypothetical protein